MAFWDKPLDAFKKVRLGRRRKEPERQTDIYPKLMRLGTSRGGKHRPQLKPTPRNLRFFSRTPYARRAINAIKNPIAMLEWEVIPIHGVNENSLLKKQCEIVRTCLESPNDDDSFRSMLEQVLEDMLHGAGAIEQQIGSDEKRPLWMWPVDGLSIQVFAGWDGNPGQARYLQTMGYGPVGGVDGIPLRDDELIYIKPHPTTWSPFGFGPLEVAFMTISRQLGVAQYAGDLASNAQPANVLYLGKNISTEELDSVRTWWQNEVEGRGKMPIIGGPEDPEILALHGGKDEALYLKYQEFLAREIAVAFDLSPQNLGVEADVNRNTSEVAEDRDWDHAIKPWAHLYQSYINRKAIRGRLGNLQALLPKQRDYPERAA
jgi:hypothetical protein